MRIFSKILGYMKLDQNYSLLSCRNVCVLLELFTALDVRGTMVLDDIQFYSFMHIITDLNKKEIYRLFDMLDVDRSGLIDFSEFYILICILLSVRDRQQKEFIMRHSQTVFELMDEDASGTISAVEFDALSFLFNFKRRVVKDIFHEFDISGDQQLSYKEFRMFILACIDRQVEMEDVGYEKQQGLGAVTQDWCSLQ